MKVLKNVLIICIAISASFLLAQAFGEIYAGMFHDHGSWVNAASLAGIPIVYILFITLLFTAFGGVKKYWWLGISLTAVLVVFYLDWYHWYFWVAVGLLGWLFGLCLQKLVAKLKK